MATHRRSRLSSALLLGALAVVEPSVGAAPCSPAHDADWRSPVVRVNAGGAMASGVVVGQDRVLTAAHVVAGEARIDVEIYGHRWPAERLAAASESDLALLSVRTFGIGALPVFIGRLRPGTAVSLVSYPGGGDLTQSPGRIETHAETELVVAGEADDGSSGGAVVRCGDPAGPELAGLIVAARRTTPATRTDRRFLVLARPGALVAAFLRSQGSLPVSEAQRSPGR